MKHTLPLVALTALIGLALATPSQAAIVTYYSAVNGPGVCQAFTPGPSNTIRNRVIGAENVGTATMNVACDLTTRHAGTYTGTSIQMYFSNNNPSGTISVSCTLLTGFQTGTNRLFTKTVNVTAGAQASMSFVPTDLDATFTNFQSLLVGVNCALPGGGVINDIYYGQSEENGVGS